MVSTSGKVVSSKTESRFPIAGQQGHRSRIIQADLINDGDSREGYFYDYPGSFNQPRSFIDNTIEEIEKIDSVENALANGLRKRNYDVT